MGPAFVYMMWIIIIALFLPVFVYGVKIKSWLYRIIGGIPVAFILLCIIGLLLKIHLAGNPDFALKVAFWKLPENEIKVIEHEYTFSTDSDSIYLKFEVNREDFDEIINTGFEKTDKDGIEQLLSYSDKPVWFTPLKEGVTEFYKSPFFRGGYASSNTSLSY